MKIIIVGGAGHVGRAAVKALAPRHDVIIAGRESGDVTVDMADSTSIEAMFESVGEFDALISTAGQVVFAPFDELDEAAYQVGLNNKLMGQVNLVRIGQAYINEGGSFTLTSGVLTDDPIPQGASASMVNSAVNGFVKAASIVLPKKIRLNAVSPGLLDVSAEDYAPYFPGFKPVSSIDVGLAYQKSVEGLRTGEIFSVI